MPVAAATNAIISLADVKDFLKIGVNAADTTQDDFLQTWINYVSSELEGITGINNKVKVQDVASEITNGTGRTKLRTLYYPIYAIGVAASTTDVAKLASVQYRDDVDSAWTDIETDIDHILINTPDIFHVSEQNTYNIELSDATFPAGQKNIKVSYQAGWSSIPAAIVMVALEKVSDVYKQSSRGGSRFGLNSFSESEGMGSKNTNYKDLTKRHEEMLKPFRRRY